MPKNSQKTAQKESSKKEPATKKGKYFRGIGRRKLATAGVKIFHSPLENKVADIMINGKPHKDYFSRSELAAISVSPLEAVAASNISKVSVTVKGGGIRGQAEAVRLGLARALVLMNDDFRKPLKSIGYLTRDARKVERKKAGLKKARRAPQFSKR